MTRASTYGCPTILLILPFVAITVNAEEAAAEPPQAPPAGREAATTTVLADGRALVVGGDVSGTAEIYDPATGQTVVIEARLNVPRAHHSAVLLADGNVLIVGGYAASTASIEKSAEIFNVAESRFSKIGGPRVTRLQPALTLRADGVVQVTGGDVAGSTEFYDPAAGTFGDDPAAPSVITERSDYSPGEIVTFMGWRWMPGEDVRLVLREEPVQHSEREIFVAVDVAGKFVNTDFAPEEHDIGVAFHVTATGMTSGRRAFWTFTDAAPPVATYTITAGSGVVLGGGADIGNHCDDCVTSIALPFPVTLYDQTYNTAIISSNGNIQLASTNAAFSNTPLPSFSFGSTIFAYWADLYTANPGYGIFMQTTGVAPNRIFHVRWHAQYCCTFGSPVGLADFEVLLHESLAHFEVIYDGGTPGSATIGVQQTATGPFTQYSSNANIGELAGVTLTFTGTGTPPPPPPDYTITPGVGAVLGGGSDIGNHCDDCTTFINLPFSYALYNQTYTSARVSSNGTIQFTSNSPAFFNGPLPYNGFGPAIVAYWDDLRTDGGDFGIFTQTTGIAPTRIFHVRWHARYFLIGGNADFEVLLFESQTRFDVIYGGGAPGTATIGVQRSGTGSSTQYSSIASINALAGIRLTFSRALSNQPPQVSIEGGPFVIDEGNQIVLNASASDPDHDTSTLSFAWTLLSGSGMLMPSGMSATYASNDGPETAIVRVTVTDPEDAQATATATITVNNVAPTVLFAPGPSGGALDEGMSYRASGSFSDPGADAPWSATVDYGDGSGVQPLPLLPPGPDADAGFELDHEYADNGVYTVTVSATNKDGAIGTATFQVTVNNVAPTVLMPRPLTIDEGGTFRDGGSFTDSGADTWIASVDYGDGSGPRPLALNADHTFVLSHVYPQDDLYTVTVTVTDDDGDVGTSTTAVTVRNVTPTITSFTLTDATIGENGIAEVFGTLIDPGVLDPHIVTINWSDGSMPAVLNLQPGETSFSALHQYLDDNPAGTPADAYGVVAMVTDDDEGGSGAAATLTVSNLAPDVGSISAPTTPQLAGTSISISASFADPGTLDTLTCSVDWGDSHVTAGTVGDGACSGVHGYSAAGIYTVAMTVIDDDTGTGTSIFNYVVVYSDAAFVTGGGWFNSPAGAYGPDPSLLGRANFGFNASVRGDQAEGQTELQFHRDGRMNFQSSSYDWLVVSGASALYVGSGTINGEGDYRFLVSVLDGRRAADGIHRLRIKIWDKTDGSVVYDNNPTAGHDYAVATAPIANGVIVNHQRE